MLEGRRITRCSLDEQTGTLRVYLRKNSCTPRACCHCRNENLYSPCKQEAPRTVILKEKNVQTEITISANTNIEEMGEHSGSDVTESSCTPCSTKPRRVRKRSLPTPCPPPPYPPTPCLPTPYLPTPCPPPPCPPPPCPPPPCLPTPCPPTPCPPTPCPPTPCPPTPCPPTPCLPTPCLPPPCPPAPCIPTPCPPPPCPPTPCLPTPCPPTPCLPPPCPPAPCIPTPCPPTPCLPTPCPPTPCIPPPCPPAPCIPTPCPPTPCIPPPCPPAPYLPTPCPPTPCPPTPCLPTPCPPTPCPPTPCLSIPCIQIPCPPALPPCPPALPPCPPALPPCPPALPPCPPALPPCPPAPPPSVPAYPPCLPTYPPCAPIYPPCTPTDPPPESQNPPRESPKTSREPTYPPSKKSSQPRKSNISPSLLSRSPSPTYHLTYSTYSSMLPKYPPTPPPFPPTYPPTPPPFPPTYPPPVQKQPSQSSRSPSEHSQQPSEISLQPLQRSESPPLLEKNLSLSREITPEDNYDSLMSLKEAISRLSRESAIKNVFVRRRNKRKCDRFGFRNYNISFQKITLNPLWSNDLNYSQNYYVTQDPHYKLKFERKTKTNLRGNRKVHKINNSRSYRLKTTRSEERLGLRLVDQDGSLKRSYFYRSFLKDLTDSEIVQSVIDSQSNLDKFEADNTKAKKRYIEARATKISNKPSSSLPPLNRSKMKTPEQQCALMLRQRVPTVHPKERSRRNQRRRRPRNNSRMDFRNYNISFQQITLNPPLSINRHYYVTQDPHYKLKFEHSSRSMVTQMQRIPEKMLGKRKIHRKDGRRSRNEIGQLNKPSEKRNIIELWTSVQKPKEKRVPTTFGRKRGAGDNTRMGFVDII